MVFEEEFDSPAESVDDFRFTLHHLFEVKSGFFSHNSTLFLPHGYEGQGPEHSSARIERFLALCGDENMVVTNPSTPAQLFHLLRRHILAKVQKPLIVFTPKALLRHPECVSDLEVFTGGAFEELIDDPEPSKPATELVFCSGKIYYELLDQRRKAKSKKMALIRLEQLYPLDVGAIEKVIKRYPTATKITWAQEEPSNMGAWDFIRPQLREHLPKKATLRYVGRDRSAASAAGSLVLHNLQHDRIIRSLFG